ncbi:MAG: T9SS type A sorting domain-containing protein, partial [Bacteroidetes bacterium]
TTNQVKWKREINGFFSTAPAIGLDGVIYAGSGSRLYALHPQNGADKWVFTTPIAPAGYPTIQNITSEPVVGNNGTIYFSALTAGDNGGAIFAIHPEGYPKWFFSSGITIYTSPVLANDETIYYPADKLYVLDKYGKEIWSKEAAGVLSPVLAADGSTYFGSWEHNGITAITGNHGGLATAHWPAFAHDFQHSGQHDDSFVGIPPTITVQPENLIIKSGQTATFSVSVTGDPTIKYQWYEGTTGDKTKPVGTDSVYTTPALTKMTSYWVEVENEFGKDVSTTVMASTGNVGEVKWFYLTNPTFSNKEDGEIMSGVALAKDGTLYFPVYDGRLFAMNPDKSLKWIASIQAYTDEYEIVNAVSTSTPTIGSDGTIYVNTLGYYLKNYSDQHDFGILWAINPDGSEKWRYIAGHVSIKETNYPDAWLRGSVAIGHDGTIYIVTEGGTLHAVNPDGSVKWKFNAAANKSWYRGLKGNSPVVGTDGTIYYVAGGEFKLHDVSSMETRIFAINSDGIYKWDFLLIEDKVFFSENTPAIGPDGKIYVDNNNGSSVSYLFALNPDGTKAWEFNTGQNTGSSAVIAKDGTIYISGSSYVSSAHRIKIYALNPDGTEKWRFPKDGEKDKFGFAISTPVIGADNNIYYGTITANVGGSDGRLYALKPDGTALWSNPPNLGNTVFSPPVIAPDGTLYTGTGEGYENVFHGFLYAVNTTAFGVANTAWPMDGQNPQRVQRAVGFPQCTEPLITIQPNDTIITSGEAVKLTINATGADLNYQWFEGVDRSKPVGTGKSFVTTGLEKTTVYWVQASNTCGSENSRKVTVTVNPPVFDTRFATLAKIQIGNEQLTNFSSTTFEYQVVLPAGTAEIPSLAAYSTVIGATVEISKTTSAPGTATIHVISPDGVTKQTYIIHFTMATGIVDAENKDFLIIYPNPATDKFKVQSSGACPTTGGFRVEKAKIEIYDLNGRKLLEKPFPEGNKKIEVDVSHLKNGVYFCKLSTKKESVTKKLIIQK